MRVLIINKFLYPNGGSETYIFKLGEALEQHGHEVQYFGMEHEGRLLLLWRFSAVSVRPGQGGSWNRQAPVVAAPFSRSASFPPASAL